MGRKETLGETATMIPEAVRPLTRRRKNPSSAVVHWRKYVGQALAERLQLRCSLLLESDGGGEEHDDTGKGSLRNLFGGTLAAGAAEALQR